MSSDLEKDLPLKLYLLGDLNPEELSRIEQRLMIDASAFEEVGWVEDELIDDYLEGALSLREKEKFESCFLAAPERQRKLSFARNLKRYTAAHRPEQSHLSVLWNSFQASWRISSPVLRWAPAVSLLLIMIVGSWSALRITALRNTIEEVSSRESQNRLVMQTRNSALETELQSEQARSRQLEQEVASLRSADNHASSSLSAGQLSATLVALALAPGRQRDLDGSRTDTIPEGTDFLRLDLEIESQGYSEYQATLRRAEDEGTIWTHAFAKSKSRAQDLFLRLDVSAKELRRGDYAVKLRGKTAGGDYEDINTYYFRVIPK